MYSASSIIVWSTKDYRWFGIKIGLSLFVFPWSDF
jgi:hypothetical protein